MQPYLNNARSAAHRYSRSPDTSSSGPLATFRNKLRRVGLFGIGKTKVKHSDHTRRDYHRNCNGAIIDNEIEDDAVRVPLEVEDLRSESVLQKYERQEERVAAIGSIRGHERLRHKPRETLSKLPEAGLITVDRSDQIATIPSSDVSGRVTNNVSHMANESSTDSPIGVITNVLTARNDLLIYGPSTSGIPQPAIRYHNNQINSYSSSFDSSVDNTLTRHITLNSHANRSSVSPLRQSNSSHVPVVQSHVPTGGFVRYEIDGDPEALPSVRNTNSPVVRQSLQEIVRDSQNVTSRNEATEDVTSLPGSVQGSSNDEGSDTATPTSARSQTSSGRSQQSGSSGNTKHATVVTPSVVMLNSRPEEAGVSAHPALYSSHFTRQGSGSSHDPIYSQRIEKTGNVTEPKLKNGILKNSYQSTFQHSDTFSCSTLEKDSNQRGGEASVDRISNSSCTGEDDPKHTLRSQMKKKPPHSRLAHIKSESGNGTLRNKSPYEQKSTYF